MTFERDPNDRRRVDAETQRNRDAEVARLRRDGVSYRHIAHRLDMSLGAVQKSVRRAQKLAEAMAGGEPGDVVAAVCDDGELKCADVTCAEDVERLSALERWRLRHMPGEFGDAERARSRIEHAVDYRQEQAERERFRVEHADEIAAIGFDAAWYGQERFHVSDGRSWRAGVDRAMSDDSGVDADEW